MRDASGTRFTIRFARTWRYSTSCRVRPSPHAVGLRKEGRLLDAHERTLSNICSVCQSSRLRPCSSRSGSGRASPTAPIDAGLPALGAAAGATPGPGTARRPVIVEIDSIKAVDPARITDAARAPSGSRGRATRSARSSPAARAPTTGSRSTSRGRSADRAARAPSGIPDSAWAELAAELDRIDRATKRGPWTIATLRLIGDRPEVAAADLAAAVGPRAAAVQGRRAKAEGAGPDREPAARLPPLSAGAGLLDFLSRRATRSPSGRGRSAARG